MKIKSRVGLLFAALLFLGGPGEASPADLTAKESLQRLQDFVGSWKRGVGQPKRGSVQGAWIEEADWAWDFEGDAPALVYGVEDGKYLKSARLLAGEEDGTFRMLATGPEGKIEETYTGRLDDEGRLVLVNDDPEEGRPGRISLRLVAGGKRLLALYERRLGSTDRYLRMAEVGYTREGSGFGKPSVADRECVVTGGAGTIAVSYQGKTYYVCCTGCRDYFDENPEEVLADYRARKEEEPNEKPGS